MLATSSATARKSAAADPPLNLPAARSAVLAAVLKPDRLPTPPAVALQVVQAASRPDCEPADIVTLLNRDPALCAKLLKAVNSCVYGLSRPVASVARAVTILGLNAVRSLSLGLSLPALRTGSGPDPALRDYWVGSVSGAIIARELATRVRRPCPDDDMVAGLLRNLGAPLLRQTFPAEWEQLTAACGDRLFAEQCDAEDIIFGANHADVTAELLGKWNLPIDLTEPIRHHHRPQQLADRPPLAERAQLLYFAELLTQLDSVVQHPEALEFVLTTARDRYSLPTAELTAFLQGVVPKVTEFSKLIDQDIGQCPDFGAILADGAAELVNLTVENNRTRLSGTETLALTRRRPAGPATPPPAAPLRPAETTAPEADSGDIVTTQPLAAVLAPELARLPEFTPAFIDRFPPGGCRLGEYHLQEKLGRGAMGVVFKAFEPALARFAAVKMIAPDVSAATMPRERFAREARSAAAIRHENVVVIYSVREAAGLPYLAMEYVEGESLDDYLGREGPPPARVIARVARQVAAGLAAAHARGIVHRDIKPANILLERGTDRVKLTDFGLARGAADRKLSQDGALIGTPHFMSPEQIQGGTVGPHSDLFGLGAVLYLLCTGMLPFPGDDILPVLRGVCDTTPEQPRRIRPTLPSWLDALVMKLLSKNPLQRGSAADAAALVAEKMPG